MRFFNILSFCITGLYVNSIINNVYSAFPTIDQIKAAINSPTVLTTCGTCSGGAASGCCAIYDSSSVLSYDLSQLDLTNITSFEMHNTGTGSLIINVPPDGFDLITQTGGNMILAYPDGNIKVHNDSGASVLILNIKTGEVFEAYGSGGAYVVDPQGNVIVRSNDNGVVAIDGLADGASITNIGSAPLKIINPKGSIAINEIPDIVKCHCFSGDNDTVTIDIGVSVQTNPAPISISGSFYIDSDGNLKKDFTRNGTFIGDVLVRYLTNSILINNVNISVLCPTIGAPYDGYIFDGTDSISFNGTIDNLGGCTGIVVTINNGTITLHTSSASLDIATKQWTALFDQKDLVVLVDGDYTLEIDFTGDNCDQVSKTCNIIKDSRNIFESINSSCELINGKLVYYMSFLREVNIDGIGVDLFVKKYSNKGLKKGFKWQVIDTDLEISNEGSLIQGYSKNFIAKFTPKEDGKYILERYKNDNLHDYWGNIVGPMKSNECFVELPKPFIEEEPPAKRTKIPNNIAEIIYYLSEHASFVFNHLNVDARNAFYANKDSLLEYAKFKDENLDHFKNLIPVVQFAFANNACSIAIYEQFESIPGNGLLEYFDKLSHEQKLEYANDCQKITDFLHKYLEKLSRKIEPNIILEDKTLADKALTITKEKQLDYSNLMNTNVNYEDLIRINVKYLDYEDSIKTTINTLNSKLKNNKIKLLKEKTKKVELPRDAALNNSLSNKTDKINSRIIKNNQNFITVDLNYIKEDKENANKEYLQKISDKIFYDNKNKISKNYIIKYGDSMINFTEIEDSPFYFGYGIKKGVDAMGYYRQIKLNTIKDENKFDFGSYFVITKSKHYLID